MIISMIVAIGKERQIGAGNKMLWHISDEFKHFKKTTMGHTLLMGRKCFESIGRPLPGRTTIIMTRDKSYQQEGCLVVHSLKEGIELARSRAEEEIFIAGGGEIYQQGLALTQKLYLSIVNYNGEADVFFPDYTKLLWEELINEKHQDWELSILERRENF